MKNLSSILTIALSLSFASAYAGQIEQEKAYKLHNRLTGVPPKAAVLATMENLIIAGNYEGAAEEAMKNSNFYNIILKNWVKSWSNRDLNPRVELNDFVATVIGMIRDSGTVGMPFDEVLYGDIIYTVAGAATAYSPDANKHYGDAEIARINLMTSLTRNQQSALNAAADPAAFPNLPGAAATAGVMTTRTAAENFYQAGTNRRMNRYMFINFLCKDYEELHDISIPDNFVERDVERNPGGDSRTYLTKCVGCHAGQDALRRAHAYYDYDVNKKIIQYTPGVVASKITRVKSYLDGAVTMNDSWTNPWANGQNSKLGWRSSVQGSGAKSLGKMLARSRAFSVCMAKRVFKLVCIKDAKTNEDKATVERNATLFETNNEYDMKKLIVKTSAGCVANE